MYRRGNSLTIVIGFLRGNSSRYKVVLDLNTGWYNSIGLVTLGNKSLNEGPIPLEALAKSDSWFK